MQPIQAVLFLKEKERKRGKKIYFVFLYASLSFFISLLLVFLLKTAASLIDTAWECCHLDSWEIKDRSRRGKSLLAKCPEERGRQGEGPACRGPHIWDEGTHRAVLDQVHTDMLASIKNTLRCYLKACFV